MVLRSTKRLRAVPGQNQHIECVDYIRRNHVEEASYRSSRLLESQAPIQGTRRTSGQGSQAGTPIGTESQTSGDVFKIRASWWVTVAGERAVLPAPGCSEATERVIAGAVSPGA